MVDPPFRERHQSDRNYPITIREASSERVSEVFTKMLNFRVNSASSVRSPSQQGKAMCSL